MKVLHLKPEYYFMKWHSIIKLLDTYFSEFSKKFRAWRVQWNEFVTQNTAAVLVNPNIL